tara:strand:- start:1764 stop:2276 length:513 start_codon:yes stop_codon:yes gene_type:complete
MADKVKYNAEVDLAGGVTTTTVTTSGKLTVNSGGMEVASGVSYFLGGFVFPQAAAEALAADNNAISNANISARVMTIAASGAHTKATPDGENLVTTLGLTTNNDCADLSIINTATNAAHFLTVSAGSNVTIVGSPIVYARQDDTGNDTIGSALFRVRRTSATAVTIYRIA